ncbi:hypothetical protein WA1_34950 [Scytonema hofmannii PCC 7110]|uniref:Uncharacterized protein n=1 Tax=Scytonema hofmannii PCC 7110 TaxID=128403 RepID=A0A139X2C3_9CYAN|nr:COP23 domain-containing protein [Scytonema hofmannii]KYC38803.1 hypothetical protein WA1_34950 [Scytonema hofmannii PCC 7110]
MKIQTLISAITSFLITFIYTIVISRSTNFQTIGSHFSPSPTLTADSRNSNITFFCGEKEGVPATLARTFKGTYPIIKWKKKYYSETEEDPLIRCVRVSGIIHTYHQQGILDYINIGKIQGKRVVCAINQVDKKCSRLLYILEPGENPKLELKVLREVLKHPSESEKIRSRGGYAPPRGLKPPSNSTRTGGGR